MIQTSDYVARTWKFPWNKCRTTHSCNAKVMFNFIKIYFLNWKISLRREFSRCPLVSQEHAHKSVTQKTTTKDNVVVHKFQFCCHALHFKELRQLPLSQMDSHVDASRWKFAKPELVYGLCKSARKFTQVVKGRRFHAYTDDLWSTCVVLDWVAKRWKMCLNFHTN